MKERNLSIDMLRIIACLMVISLHITAAYKYGNFDTFEWKVSVVYDSVSICAVPIFFMISGAFLEFKDVKSLFIKTFRFIFVFFTASAFYTFSDSIWNAISLKDYRTLFSKNFFEAMINYKYHLWYLPAYIYVLLFSPIIILVMKMGNENLNKYIVYLFIVFGLLINTISTAIDGFENYAVLKQYISVLTCFMSGNHLGYFVLGRYLINKNIPQSIKRVLGLMSLLSSVLLYCLTIAYSNISGAPDIRWMNSLNVFTAVQAVTWFVCFKDLKIQSAHNILVRCILGVYLTHVFFLDWFTRLNIFTYTGLGNTHINILISIPLKIFVIFLCSFIWIYIYKYIIMKFISKKERFKK